MSPDSLIVITGSMAAGKSTVAQALAERRPRSVHVRGDAFRRMIVNGRADMGPGASPEALLQLRLRYAAAAQTARLYREAGFDVVLQDVILGPALDDALDLLDRPFSLVVLCPSIEAVTAREAGRAKTGYGAFTPADLDRVLRVETRRVGLWLDTSELDVDETVDRILAGLEDARID